MEVRRKLNYLIIPLILLLWHKLFTGLIEAKLRSILKINGKVILVWNNSESESELLKENDEICRRLCPEFKGFSGVSDVSPEAYSDFFKNGYCDYKVFDNNSLVTLE